MLLLFGILVLGCRLSATRLGNKNYIDKSEEFMPKKRKNKRIGIVEQNQIDKLVKKIKQYRIFWDMRNQRETKFNDRLLDYLRQNPNPMNVGNRKIPTVEFFGETFRPEFYLQKGSSKNLCAVECKRFKGRSVKGGLKAGLSQALLYTTRYKYVVLLLLDFTKGKKVVDRLGRGNKTETSLVKQLQKKSNLRIVALRPVDNEN